jgi:hypothetical protein
MVFAAPRAAQPRIHRGCGKKLRRALRYQLTRQGVDDWLEQLAAEEPDAAVHLKGREPPEGNGEIPKWCALYWRAFGDLTHDRDYVSETILVPTTPGAPPAAIVSSRPLALRRSTLRYYAAEQGVAGADFEIFVRLVRALDLEYLQILSEKKQSPSGGSEIDDG